MAFSAAATIEDVLSPYLANKSVGFPLSPKVSITATYSCGTGQLREATLATLSPKPPFAWCSSAVTTQPVLVRDCIMAASSSGLMVCILIKSTLIPFSANCLAASTAIQTKWPQAMMLTSVPSASTCALPISKFWFSAVKLAHFGRPKRRYTGPS